MGALALAVGTFKLAFTVDTGGCGGGCEGGWDAALKLPPSTDLDLQMEIVDSEQQKRF